MTTIDSYLDTFFEPRKALAATLRSNQRSDKRKIDECRDVDVKIIGQANHSAVILASIGNTLVSAEVVLQVVDRTSSMQGEIEFQINSWQSATGKADSRSKPDQVVVLESQLQSIFSSPHTLDLTQLKIEKSVWAFRLLVSLTLVAVDGCVLNGCVLAVSSVLKSVKLPHVKFCNAKEIVFSDQLTCSLNFGSLPISVTSAVINDIVVLDPTNNELDVADASVTAIFNVEGSVLLCLQQTRDGGGISQLQCVNLLQVMQQHHSRQRQRIPLFH